LGAARHDDPHDGGITGKPFRDVDADGAGTIEVGGVVRTMCERVGRHRHGEVRSLAADVRAIGKIEPLTTDLAERIGSAPRGRSSVRTLRRPRGRIEHGVERREQRLSVLGIEVAVDTNDAVPGDRRVKSPPFAHPLVGLDRAIPLRALAPERRDALEVRDRVDARGVDELMFRSFERFGLAISGRHEQTSCGERHLTLFTLFERLSRLWHVLERARKPHLLPGRTPRDSVRPREPARRREMAIAFADTPAIELGESAQAFDLEQLARALQLREVFLDPRKREGSELFGA
jgi:hypothetical protein